MTGEEMKMFGVNGMQWLKSATVAQGPATESTFMADVAEHVEAEKEQFNSWLPRVGRVVATADLVAIAAQHEVLGIDATELTSERADAIMNRVGVNTTTELLLLLARFHADVDDEKGASMLLEFAERFAVVEAEVV